MFLASFVMKLSRISWRANTVLENLIFWRLLRAQIARAFFHRSHVSCTQLVEHKNRLEIPTGWFFSTVTKRYLTVQPPLDVESFTTYHIVVFGLHFCQSAFFSDYFPKFGYGKHDIVFRKANFFRKNLPLWQSLICLYIWNNVAGSHHFFFDFGMIWNYSKSASL